MPRSAEARNTFEVIVAAAKGLCHTRHGAGKGGDGAAAHRHVIAAGARHLRHFGAVMAAVAALAPLSAAALLSTTQKAAAQSENVSVTERARPEYDPLGIRIGGFLLRSRTTLGVLGNDNVFATETGKKDDIIYTADQRVTLNSTWSRHALGFGATGRFVGHHDLTDEDRTEWSVFGNGRLDITDDTAVGFSGQFEELAEERSSPSSPTTAVEPIEYNVVTASANARHRLNRVTVLGDFDFRDYEYEDGRTSSGAVIDQGGRDRKTYDVVGRVEYEYSARTFLFAEGAGNFRVYDRQPPLAPLDRDSRGARFLVGAGFDLTRLVRGEVGVGYLIQFFDDPASDETSGFAARGNVEWFVTGLTTVNFGVAFDQEVSDVAGTPGSETMRASVGVDHELLRNLILSASAEYAEEDFVGIDRDDAIYSIDVGAKYLINRHLTFQLAYSHDTRESSGTAMGRDYDVNRIGAALVIEW